MSDCPVSRSIAIHCNDEEPAECEVCYSSMVEEMKNGYELLVCDCGHKVWADGEEYND